MPVNNNPLSAISYTNKDFRSILPELLDLVKKLTYKWDPSISNESDPGVILLKLDALIADKNNYNIDKNILEAFPETVTQEVSARNMYKQLAYIMPWYKSATTTVTFRWVGENLTPGETVTIPMFTMLTDSESSKIFTLIEEVQFSYDNTQVTGRAIQGTITDVTVNGSTVLKLDNIDYNNRIYLNDYNVAENGIFISNAEESSLGFWERVDNLQVEEEGNKYYEFGVDSRTNLTYVEFPNDIETLIRAGLNIKYLISDGLNGNINANEITNFYEDVTVDFRGEDLNLNEEVIEMYNPSATVDGEDPEPVSEAYNSYKRVAGTFDTLVTLRDYTNAIYLSGLVSNDIVSDRLHDIQSSYSIITDSYGSSDHFIEIREHDVEQKWQNSDNEDYTRTIKEDDLTAYDLKLYLLHNSGVINNITAFNETFNMEPSQSDIARQVQSYVQSTKCISHDFQDILPDIPCLFRIIYPIKIKFVPQYQLTPIQVDDVKRNIIQALYDTLNSRAINFGEEPNYYVIYDAVMNADERIKIITVDDFNYTTYATYWDEDNSKFKHVPVSLFNNDPWIITKNGEKGQETFEEVTKGINNLSMYTYIALDEDNKVYTYNNQTKTFEEYSDKINEFRKDIIAKAVLAGVTPLYKQENSFNYSIDQSFDHIDTNVDRVTTDLVLSPWGFDDIGDDNYTPKEWDEDTTDTIKEYILKDNESIQFLAPSFITEMNYSNYVKFELVLQTPTQSTPEMIFASVSDFGVTSNQLPTENTEQNVEANYQGQKPILYIGLELGGYDPFVNLADTKNDQNYSYVEGQHAGSLSWFLNNKNYTVIGYDGTPTTTTPYRAWQNGYIALYTQEQVYRIKPDTDYKLQNGDSITFFWKETDEDDAPYTYRCYKGIANETEENRSPIIRGTFNINGTSKNNCLINPDTLSSTGTIKYDTHPSSNYQKIYSMYGDNTLSGTKSIDTRMMNQITLEKENAYYYIITNNIQTISNKEQYVMDFEATPMYVPGKFYTKNGDAYSPVQEKPATWGYSDGQSVAPTYYTKDTNSDSYSQVEFKYEYTLKTDEYFIHINRNMTSYELVGAGTLIRLNENTNVTSLPRFTCETVPYLTVSTQGLDAINDKTKVLPVQTLIREQQMYNLVGGDRFAITLNDPNSSEPFTGINFTDANGDNHLCFPYFSTTQPNVVRGYTVQYGTGDAGLQELPGIEVQDDTSSWIGTAILNLNCTYDEAQIIDNSLPDGADSNEDKKSLQQVTIGRTVTDQEEDTEQYVTVSYPKNPYTSDQKYNMLANITLSKNGGINIDVTYLDAYGERSNINLYAFELNSAFNTPPFSKSAEYGIRMNFKLNGEEYIQNIPGLFISGNFTYNTNMPPANKQNVGKYCQAETPPAGKLCYQCVLSGSNYTWKSVSNITIANDTFFIPNIKLQPGYNYILGIRNTSATQKFWLKYDNIDYVDCINEIIGSGNQNKPRIGLGQGKYYFLLKNLINISEEDNKEFSLQLVISGEDENGFLEFDDLVKCIPNDMFDKYNISNTDIEKLVREYDYHGYFQYNYKIPNDILIEEPLEGKNFFNENHPFNQYAIGYVNLIIPSDTETNNKASSIDVMNNR